MTDEANAEFDAIVVGSGITGGWVAKELCERGLKVLVVERGRHLDHPGPEYTDFDAPWELEYRGMVPDYLAENDRYEMLRRKRHIYRNEHRQFFVDDAEHPYSFPDDRPFMWTRGYQLGGRSLTWARQCYRWSQKDFDANHKDGYGSPWPIGYDDLAPWYSRVEAFAGISGNADGLENLPDGDFLKPWDMSAAEEQVAAKLRNERPDRPMIIGRCANLTEEHGPSNALGRGVCQARNRCSSGCAYGAYFSSLSATLPAARLTGNLTVVTDATVESVVYDKVRGKVTGVRVIRTAEAKRETYSGKMVFLNAGSLNSVHLLLNSKGEGHPAGLANSSGMLGAYIMDHFGGSGASGDVPGLDDRYAFGRRPVGIYVPNYRHGQLEDADFLRGFGFQGSAQQRKAERPNANAPGIGKELWERGQKGPRWRMSLFMYGEMLPYKDNRATLHPTKTDRFGIPLLHMDCEGRENEKKMRVQGAKDAVDLLTAGGCVNVREIAPDPNAFVMLGERTHEMGGACMGTDPKSSVVNGWCQTHDIPNLFVSDGAVMASCGTSNPSLTYMALSARAAHHAADLLQEGQL